MAQPTANSNETGPFGVYEAESAAGSRGTPLVLVGGAASKIVPGATSLSHRNNADGADNLLITDAGAVTGRTSIEATTSLKAGTTLAHLGNRIMGGAGAAGGALTLVEAIVQKTGIADNTATDVLTVTIPNVSTCAAIRLFVLASFDASPINDSARAYEYIVLVTRRAGVAAVAALIPVEYSATNPVTNVNQLVKGQIATLAAGVTFTSVLTLGSITGGATVSETFTIAITNVASAGTPTTQAIMRAEVLNQLTGGVTIAAA